MLEQIKDKTKIKIEDLLRSYPDGLTIKEMMDKTGLARHTLLARLHNLEGQDKIGVRQINMAKLHRWKHENEEKKEEKPEDVKVAEIKEEHIKKPEPKIQKKSVERSVEELKEFKFSPEMSVNEATIDGQHIRLLKQINKLIKALSKGSDLGIIRDTINFLGKYAKEHITYEETYMKKIKYPELSDHQNQHAIFIKFTEEFKQDFREKYTSKEQIIDIKELAKKAHKFLGDWFINHIMIEDHKYSDFVSGKKSKTKSVQKPEISREEPKKGEVDFEQIKREIERELKGGKIDKKGAQIKQQREPIRQVAGQEVEVKRKKARPGRVFVKTGVPGFDELLEEGIPKAATVLVAGGAGSGKTIFCLQTFAYQVAEGKKCLYMSFEESEKRLIEHMDDFGWNPKELIKEGNLKIQRFNPFDITRNVDALLAKQKGELLIDIDPVILPKGFEPDFIVVDSLTAIASAFTEKEESYRVYIEQLFRFFEKIGATSFLITETEQVPKIFSKTGVEEFLADGVIVLYSLRHGNVRENAIEVLKLRGAAHKKKIVAMQITDKGVVVYPDQEIFGGLK